jgi:predicted dehydrogenase
MALQKIKIAIIGYGYWGKIIVSKLLSHPYFELKYICDPKLDLDHQYMENQSIHLIQDQSIILNDSEIKAVLIAVPPIFHYQVAKACLLSKKHVWLEKPACTNLKDFERLNHLATQYQCILHVDYLYIFNPLIHTIKKLIKDEKIISFHSIRTNQNHIGASSGLGDTLDLIYDLGVHDLSILKYICDDLEMIDIQINIKSNLNMVDLEILKLNLKNDSEIDIKIHLNWQGLHKTRSIKINTDRKELILTLDSCHKEMLLVKDLDQEIDHEFKKVDVLSLDVLSLDVLSLSINAFYEQIKSNTQDQMILKIASAIHQSIEQMKALI